MIGWENVDPCGPADLRDYRQPDARSILGPLGYNTVAKAAGEVAATASH